MKANLVYRGTTYQQSAQVEATSGQTCSGTYRGCANLISIGAEPQPALNHGLPLIYRGSTYSAASAADVAVDVVLQPAI